ncbi:mannosyl-3-phosphoglycerate synthase [Phaeosphaeria sp. MPI-PUGE-AT-0046c]|nr:mannosyl-3-phosphoglycerate synthase [Phaeosphaeria sp. MPI-PUGE-AT-0046c]
MRLSATSASSRIGTTEIHDTFRVVELDAGHLSGTTTPPRAACAAGTHANQIPTTVAFSQEALHAVEAQLAIVVPCKDEDVSILDGVLRGVPHDCLIILLSNSKPDNFDAECALLTDYCTMAQRSGIVAHQHDAGIARAFVDAGMPQIVADKIQPPRIRNGKGEAMIIGVTLAKLVGKQYVGFVDADNLVAGSVHEYCKVYAAGLCYAQQCNGVDNSSHTMVRIKWNSKPKVKDGVIVFEKSGRSSRVVNHWMNRLLKAIAKDNADDSIIQTGNAGEHAMSIEYAMDLKFATGYAVEPYQLVDTWERLGGLPVFEQLCIASPHTSSRSGSTSSSSEYGEDGEIGTFTPTSSLQNSVASTPATSRPASLCMSTPPPVSVANTVRILQIETRNPHFHDTGKGVEHISKMQAEGLSTIYHSRLISEELKYELREYVKANLSGVAGVGDDGELAAPRIYPSVSTMNLGVFQEAVKAGATNLKVIGHGHGMNL